MIHAHWTVALAQLIVSRPRRRPTACVPHLPLSAEFALERILLLCTCRALCKGRFRVLFTVAVVAGITPIGMWHISAMLDA